MNTKEKIISLIPVTLITLLVFIILLTVEFFYQPDISSLYETPTSGSFYDTLSWLLPLFLAIIFILIIISFLLSVRYLKKLFKVDKKTWIALLLIFLIGFSLRVFAAPHGHRLYFDEDIYLNIGQNIARDGKAVFCNYGTQEKCFEWQVNKEPNGFPFLMSIVFLFGTSESVAFTVNAIIGSITIFLVFFIGYLLFENRTIGLFSAMIFSLIPVAIQWAPTASSETAFMFFTGLTVFAFLSYFKTNKNILLLFSFASLAYTIQIRPEGVLVIFIAILMFILLKKDFFPTINKKWFIILLAIFSLLILPHIIHLNAVKDESWGANENKLGTEYISENLHDNTVFFIENTKFPLLFTIFFLIGLSMRKIWKQKLILISWFILFFCLYLFFYAGSFDHGVNVRFSLIMYIPIAILGGCGAFLIVKIFSKLTEKTMKKKYFPLVGLGIIVILIILSFLPFVDSVCVFGEKAWDARVSHDFLVKKMRELDDDCWIISNVPTISLVNGKNACNLIYIQNFDIIKSILNSNKCVFFYEDYWCNAEPIKSTICKYVHDNFKLTTYDSISEKERTFTLYRMTWK